MFELTKARFILAKHIYRGGLDRSSALRNSYRSGGVVEITNVKATVPHKGYVTAFLKELKAAGIRYDINYPIKAAQPFWQKMFERGLLPHPVSYYLPKPKPYYLPQNGLTFAPKSLNYFRSVEL